MQSSLIGKVEKAKRYAEEPERVTISSFTASFHGENDDHILTFNDGKWHCTCEFYSQRGECVHIMTLERLLGKMFPGQGSISQLA
jgi:hypothetical protein